MGSRGDTLQDQPGKPQVPRGSGLQFCMSDENLYARVVEELSTQGPVRGLWAKAYAETNGNQEAARALYLRLRVTQLADERFALADDVRRRQRSESRWREYLVIAVLTFFATVVVVSAVVWDLPSVVYELLNSKSTAQIPILSPASGNSP